MRRALLASALALALVAQAPTLRAQDEDAKTLLATGQDAEKAKPDDAVAAYRKLLDKFPNDPLAARAHLRLGLCLVKLGKNEEARAQLRLARRLGKDDPEIQRTAEKALIELPPPPEPKPAASAPAAPAPAAPASQARPEPPRSPAQLEIDGLEAEKRDLIKKAQDLEDAGKIAEAYQIRAKVDEKIALIEKKRKEMRGVPASTRPLLPGRQAKREERLAEKNADKAADRSKLMQRRKDDLEGAARSALGRALDAMSQNRPHEAAIALAEHAQLRREADQLGKRVDGGTRRLELQDELKKAREGAAAAEKTNAAQKTNDTAEALKKARDAVALAEKALHDYDAASEAADEKAQLDRLAADMKKRGAPQFEIDERLALAQQEIQLDREHRKTVTGLQRELEEKKVPEAEAKEKVANLDREHHKRIERLRDEGEGRIHARARAEMEKELARRAEEMKQSGVAPAEIESKIAALRQEMEAKLPGKRAEEKQVASTAEVDHPREKKIRELQEENRRLLKRIADLEKEMAALKAQKGAEASANAPN
jgi:hypothetical protein